MNPEEPALVDHVDSGAGGRRAFIRHFLEMLLVMFAGMGVLTGLAALGYVAAGTELSAQPEASRVLLMGVNMTIPMVAWMSFRGHPWPRNTEMAASMLIPSLVVAALVSAGGLGGMAGLGIQHAIMVPAMLGVMIWRYGHYSHPHHRQA